MYVCVLSPPELTADSIRHSATPTAIILTNNSSHQQHGHTSGGSEGPRSLVGGSEGSRTLVGSSEGSRTLVVRGGERYKPVFMACTGGSKPKVMHSRDVQGKCLQV